MGESKKTQYFSTIHQKDNEPFDYKFELPIFGESNTDISYYEPNASRIANMKKTASGLSTGVYDFEKNPGKNIPDGVRVPFGRKQGLTFEEVSQLETLNNNSIKNQADNSEKLKDEIKKQSEKNLKDAVEIANAIDNRGNSQE